MSNYESEHEPTSRAEIGVRRQNSGHGLVQRRDVRDVYEANGHDDLATSSSARGVSIKGLLRYKWSILIAAVLTLIIAEAAVWLLVVPTYRATATIEVQPIIPRLLDDEDETKPLPFFQQFLATQVNYVLSNPVLDRVLDRPEIRQTQWYQGVPATPVARYLSKPRPIDRLRSELEVDTPKGKQILQISHSCAFPGEAKRIVDAVAEEYTEYTTETRYQKDNESLKQLQGMRSENKLEIDGLKASLNALRSNPSLKSPNLDDLIASRREDLEVLSKTLKTLDLDIQVGQQRLKDLEAPAGDTATSKENFAIDAKWRQIKEEKEKLVEQLDGMLTTYGAQHRLVVKCTQKIASLDSDLREREEALRNGAAPITAVASGNDSILASLDPVLLSQKIVEMSMRKEATAHELEVKSESFNSTWKLYEQYCSIRDQLREKESVLARIDERIFDIEQIRKAPAQIRPMGKAFESDEPGDDKRPKMALAGFFGAIGAGLGIGFLRLLLSPKMHEMTELEAGPGPVLGTLPFFQNNGRTDYSAELAYQMEAIRSIRTAMMLHLQPGRGKVIQVTSAGPGAGKTTFTMMLAESFASCGKRVLVVDADLRRATLSHRIERSEEQGLADLLRDPLLTSAQICHHMNGKLFAISAGREKDSHTPELLANGRLAGTLSVWRRTFDLILVDSSPMFPIADGSMLAQQVDESIVLVRSGHCDRKTVAKALSQIESVGGSIAGVVFVSKSDTSDYEQVYGYSAPTNGEVLGSASQGQDQL